MEIGKACQIIDAEIKCTTIDNEFNCNSSDCDNRQWNYKVCTTAEHVEALEMALQALRIKFIEDMQETNI